MEIIPIFFREYQTFSPDKKLTKCSNVRTFLGSRSFFFRFLADIKSRKLVNNSRIESLLNALSKRNFDDRYIYSIVIWVVEFLKKFCNIPYHKVASSCTSCLEAHAVLFRLLMKGIFDSFVL